MEDSKLVLSDFKLIFLSLYLFSEDQGLTIFLVTILEGKSKVCTRDLAITEEVLIKPYSLETTSAY